MWVLNRKKVWDIEVGREQYVGNGGLKNFAMEFKNWMRAKIHSQEEGVS